MRVLIRNLRNGLYYGGDGDWIEEPKKAHDFGLSTKAIRHSVDKGFADFEIIFDFEDSRFNFSLGPMNSTTKDSQRKPQ